MMGLQSVYYRFLTFLCALVEVNFTAAAACFAISANAASIGQVRCCVELRATDLNSHTNRRTSCR